MLAIANLQYAWTMFTIDLTKSLNAPLDAVQWALTFFIIAQTGLFPISAYLVDRVGPRIVVALASVLVGAGWIGAGFANSLLVLYVVYGIGGLGAGAVYSACVGVAMKWFPERRGLCVGLVAGSYGFGTALTGIPIDRMIKTSGYRSAFITWGIVQGLVVLAAAQFLRMPPTGWLPAGWEAMKAKVRRKVQQSSRDFTPKEMLRSGAFYLLYLMMTLVTASGLMMTAQLKPIAVTYGFDKYVVFGSFTILTLTLLLNQVLNGSARPFFGWVSDHLGR
jgi:OFA family oxalate/formate antiporter-like MFS transporter